MYLYRKKMESLQKYTLKVYIIHDESLRFRETNMNNTLKMLRVACSTVGISFRPIMITTPTVDTLQKELNTLQEKVKYEKINDPEFDNRMHMLSIEMIANIEKHKEAWKRISVDEDPDVISLVIEDDAFIMAEFANNIVELLKVLPSQLLTSSSSKRAWDICFTGTTKQTENASNTFTFTDTKTIGKILPSKESYIISPQIIRRLINSLDTMKYTLRTHLSWFIQKNQDIRSVFPNKPIFLDGSKIGVCTSTIHPMNPLVINKEFMELWHMQNKPEISMTEIRALYKKIEHLRSPDVMHIYGRLLIERKQYMDAEDVFLSALKLMREQHGILGSSSQLLADAINNYKNIQKDIDDCRNMKSKYTEPDMDG